MSNLEVAMEYLKEGFCPIPTRDKIPVKPHKIYQYKMPTEATVREWWAEYPNAEISLYCGKVSGIHVLDLDTRDPKSEAVQLVKKMLPDTQADVKTPNKGWHFYFHYNPKAAQSVPQIVPKLEWRSDTYLIAAPTNKNYVQQKQILKREFHEVSKDILNYIYTNYTSNCKNRANGSGNTQATPKQQISDIRQHFQQGNRDHAIFHLANVLIRGGMGYDDLFRYVGFVAASCSPPFPQNEVEIKIQSALQYNDRRADNLTADIRDYIESSYGQFHLDDVLRFLGVGDKDRRKTVAALLGRLVKEGLIERVKKRNGTYRKVDAGSPAIDIMAEVRDSLDIRYPLEIERLFKTMEKNLVVIAGGQNAGKTAFLLRFTQMNFNNPMKIRYMSSEMGQQELINRIDDFADTEREDWRHVDFRERSADFQDLILPNGINIIDYLEVNDEFWAVGKMMKAIFDKLDRGIAVIALQKDGRADLGRGGSFSNEKPRLYVSITADPPAGNIAKIVKCKTWQNKRVNPNGRECVFKIRNGNEIIKQTDWHYPNKNKTTC